MPRARAGGDGVPPALRGGARWLFWLTILFVGFVTVSPIDLRPETPLGPDLERLVAFAVVGFLATLAYPRHRLRVVGALVVVAGLLEASQNLVEGRHGRVPDFAVKAAGVVLGWLAALLVEKVAALRRG